MTILLDTTVRVDLARLKHAPVSGELLAGKHLLAPSVINVGELYAGMRSPEAEATEQRLSKIECYAVTLAIAQRAGLLKVECARKGRTLKLPQHDCAATVLEHGLALMTLKRKPFPMPELRFIRRMQTDGSLVLE